MREFPGRVALGVLAVALGATAVPAAVLTVDITADELDGACVPGDCSLREAIADAVNGDTIDFALPGPPPWTIRLQAGLGQLVVDQVLTITGPGTADLVVSGDEDADGTGDLRVLRVLATADLAITGLTVRDGRATLSSDRDGGCVQNLGSLTLSSVRLEGCRGWDGDTTGFTGLPGGEGGAIRNAAGASLTMDLAAMVGNRAGKGDIGPDGTTAGRGGRGGAIANFGTLTVRRSSLSGNAAGDGGDPNGDGGEAGAIANLTGGTLLLEDSTVDGNHSGDGRAVAFGTGTDGRGGGLYLQGDATLNNVTLSGNSTGVVATGNNVGGGAINVFGGTTRLRNATITGNTGRASGGGVSRAGGTVILRNSLLAGNTSVVTANEDCFTGVTANFVSEGYNLLGVRDGCLASLVATDQRGTSASPLDPQVYPLGDYGGPTSAHALQPASPAIDLADPAGCMAWDPVSGTDVLMTADQRGEPRPVDGDGDLDPVCDVGSFEAPEPGPEQHLLTVALAGSGAGTVTSTPAGIACPGDCTEIYLATETVDLAEAAGAGSVFTGWSGDCTGTGACSVAMTVDRNVTATFSALRTLTVSVTGNGTVTSTPGGINCEPDCTEDYVDGTVVTLAAAPASGWTFASWSGDCSGSGACVLDMTANRAVGATFVVPQTRTVDILEDELDGACVATDCSLREAIADAVNGDTIDFALPGSPPWTIRLQAGLGQLVVDQVLTITGPGTADLAVSGDEDPDGTGDLRVLRVSATADLSITGLTLRDGRATLSSDRDGGCVQNLGSLTLSSVRLESCRGWDGDTSGFSGLPGGEGGAIHNAAGASLILDLSAIVGSQAGKGDIGPGGNTAGRGGRGGAIANFGTLTVRRSSLSGNAAGDGGDPNGNGGEGGAIANLTGGTLLLEDSTVDGNHSGDGRQLAFGTGADGRGGGLYLQGDATLNNVTLSGNSTGIDPASGSNVGGGGINVFGGTTRLRNATITGNTGRAGGGGVSRAGGTVRLRNSLIAGNTSVATANEDCFAGAAASFVSEGYNLLGARDGCASSLVATDQRGTSAAPLDPRLDPLGDYGGPTFTHSLQPASPAIDLADPAGCMAWDPVSGTDVLMTADQRGDLRPEDGDGDGDPVCDVGSYEAPFLDSLPFLDGFETGDTSRWSLTLP